jgi:hypothetical protein
LEDIIESLGRRGKKQKLVHLCAEEDQNRHFLTERRKEKGGKED